MRICIISDIHGLTEWKNIINKERGNVDRFIFLGDYVDDKHSLISPEEQLENLHSILDFKEEYTNVDLLIGNHDLQYIGGVRSNRFTQRLSDLIQDELIVLIREKTIQACVCYDNYLFSHAGVSRIWMREKGMQHYTDINNLFQTYPLVLDFVNKINSDAAGNNVYQSPLWIRPDSLSKSALPNYHHVVGHTRIKEISIITQEESKLIFTDTQLQQYLIIDTDNEIEEIKQN